MAKKTYSNVSTLHKDWAEMALLHLVLALHEGKANTKH